MKQEDDYYLRVWYSNGQCDVSTATEDLLVFVHSL